MKRTVLLYMPNGETRQYSTDDLENVVPPTVSDISISEDSLFVRIDFENGKTKFFSGIPFEADWG